MLLQFHKFVTLSIIATRCSANSNFITDGVLEGPERVVYSFVDVAGYAVDTHTNATAFTIADVPIVGFE